MPRKSDYPENWMALGLAFGLFFICLALFDVKARGDVLASGTVVVGALVCVWLVEHVRRGQHEEPFRPVDPRSLILHPVADGAADGGSITKREGPVPWFRGMFWMVVGAMLLGGSMTLARINLPREPSASEVRQESLSSARGIFGMKRSEASTYIGHVRGLAKEVRNNQSITFAYEGLIEDAISEIVSHPDNLEIRQKGSRR